MEEVHKRSLRWRRGASGARCEWNGKPAEPVGASERASERRSRFANRKRRLLLLLLLLLLSTLSLSLQCTYLQIVMLKILIILKTSITDGNSITYRQKTVN